MKLAPVYDCGSCLYSQADEAIMRATLDDPAEKNLRVFEIPLSGIKLNGKKINYFDFISSLAPLANFLVISSFSESSIIG